MAEKQQVFQWLEEHAGDMQQFLSSLIYIRSFSGEEFDVQQKVIAEMKAAGLEVAAHAYDEKGTRPNVVGTLKGTGGGEGLLMVAPYVSCVVFGPQPKGAHSPNERITLQEMLDAVKVFASMAIDHRK